MTTTRHFSFAAIAAVSLGTAILLPTEAFADFPAGGNVTGLTLSKSTATVGDDIVFTITGSGKCAVHVFGLPDPPLGAMKNSGPLPLTVHAPATQAGTFTIFVDVLRDTTDPMWCTGAGSAKLVVVSPLTKAAGQVTVTIPTITGVHAVDALPGNAPRPVPSIHYAGEDFQVNVTGNVPDQGNTGPNKCGYRVELQNIATGKISNRMEFDAFGVKDIGQPPGVGDYRVLVSPYSFKGTTFGPCAGKAELGRVTFHPKAAWVTGVKLVGLAYHFRMADAMGMPQFCENCSSIFSPAHDRAFLGIQATFNGTTPHQTATCAYNITQTGDGAPGTLEGVHKNGAAPISLAFPTSLNPPYWNMYNDDVNTITVTITPGNDLLYPSCNILGGKITKTIRWTKNTNAKPVVVE